MKRCDGPVGYFVHHQGRGHAERAAAIANALPPEREVVLFCARGDIFPPLASHVSITIIPSLFERSDTNSEAQEAGLLPETLHCAPLGWETITQAVAVITSWFANAKPSVFITDVSAELGQLARIASVPHITVLQHGERSDAGHMTSYQGAVGLIAPYAAVLEQPERPAWMRQKTIYAPGIGVDLSKLNSRQEARAKLGLADKIDLVAVIGGSGGTGLPSAPLTLGARAEPDSEWVTLGKIQTEWHETAPENLRHLGWVENPEDWICAADRIVSSCGNTTVHMIAAAGKPWIVTPEWRYFSEQICKAEALDAAGLAAVSKLWPGSAADWRRLWDAARVIDPAAQRAIIDSDVAVHTALSIEALIAATWAPVQQPRSNKAMLA